MIRLHLTFDLKFDPSPMGKFLDLKVFWFFPWLTVMANLKATRGGSIKVFSALFDKAVLLSYAFALDPYNLI